ncbi:MAG: leucine-rich repeat protein [Propionibacteriales bacterium]|nr:leucine-rich repeat protein [Propionibacteriales bacterium]
MRPAAAGETYTFTTDQLCPGTLAPSATNVAGAVTIDLDAIGIYDWVAIHVDATSSCRADITSLTFLGTGANLGGINIEKNTFAQTTAGVANKLTSVTFPDDIASLYLDEGAFAQTSTVGSNTLKTVHFPTGTLDSLTILNNAFRQETTATGGKNALHSIDLAAKEVTFGPDAFSQTSADSDNALSTLTITGVTNNNIVVGENAFAQHAGGNNALGEITLDADVSQLTVGASAFTQVADGNNALTTVNFPATLDNLQLDAGTFAQTAGGHTALGNITFPSTMSGLYLADDAFAQQVTGASSNTSLTWVRFPDTVQGFVVGPSAFAQTSAHGNTTLRTIYWPTSVPLGMIIEDHGFAQTAVEGHTTLASVRFPSTTGMFLIGDQAFAQTSTSNTLTSVTLPQSLSMLYLGYQVFAQSPTSVLATITLPFSGPPTSGSLVDATAAPASVDWVWFGPDKELIKDWPELSLTSPETKPLRAPISAARLRAQGVTTGVALTGYRTLTLDNLDATKTHYVYRDGQDVATPLSGQSATVGAANANANGGWTTTLPSATSSVGSFAGWCTTPVSATGACSGTTLRAGDSFTLNADTHLWALWQGVALLPPVIPSQSLGSGVAGQPFQHQIAVEGSGEIACAITAGSLPSGVSLTGCTLSGTPTAAGTYHFTVTATNAAGSATREFSLTVTAAADDLAYTGTGDLTPTVWVAALLIAVGGGLRLRRSAR